MDIKLRKATLDDVEDIADLVRKSWYKHQFFNIDTQFCKVHVKKKITEILNNPANEVYVATTNNVIIGYTSMFKNDFFFSPQKAIYNIALQSDPIIGKINEAKVIIKFIKLTEEIAEKEGYTFISISSSEPYDISKHLNKKKYKLSDKMYIRRRV